MGGSSEILDSGRGGGGVGGSEIRNMIRRNLMTLLNQCL